MPLKLIESWFDAVSCSCLCHDRADQVISEDMGPDLLPHQLRRLAAQDVHLQRNLDRSQIKFVVPPGTIQIGQVALGKLVGVEQGCYHDDGLGAKSRLFNANTQFTDRQKVWKRLVCLLVDRPRLPRFRPADDVIILSEAFAATKVGFTTCLVQSRDGVDSTLLEQYQTLSSSIARNRSTARHRTEYAPHPAKQTDLLAFARVTADAEIEDRPTSERNDGGDGTASRMQVGEAVAHCQGHRAENHKQLSRLPVRINAWIQPRRGT